jgi:hypothetical protein
MGLNPDNFNPGYSVEEINSLKQFIAETTAQPPPHPFFLYDSNHFSER